MGAFDRWKMWDGVLRREVKEFHRISLCTTCMDRLETLRRCLTQNVADNADYPNLEFVVLDYNSRRDDVWGWLSKTFPNELESGRVVYYRTDEPKFYSMTHSRNLAFRLASGTVVNNLDADNFTGKAFATFINFLANECPDKAVFSKGKRLLRGRLGFFKQEFVEQLGGYDEDLQGYGHDDKDLLERAMAMGFTLMWFGGRFVRRIATPNSEKGRNMCNQRIRETEAANRAISEANLSAGKLRANANRAWGTATVRKNAQVQFTL